MLFRMVTCVWGQMASSYFWRGSEHRDSTHWLVGSFLPFPSRESPLLSSGLALEVLPAALGNFPWGPPADCSNGKPAAASTPAPHTQRCLSPSAAASAPPPHTHCLSPSATYLAPSPEPLLPDPARGPSLGSGSSRALPAQCTQGPPESECVSSTSPS